MRLLLDTHAFLWWVFDDPKLPGTARALIAEPANDILFSVISAWEIVIKARTGRLDLPPDVPAFLDDQLRRTGFRVLPVQLRHIHEVHGLPDRHRDPFDRLLLAQARAEGLTLLTRDPEIIAYGTDTVW